MSKMKKKCIALVCASILAASMLAACGNNNDSSGQDSSSGSSGSSSSETTTSAADSASSGMDSENALSSGMEDVESGLESMGEGISDAMKGLFDTIEGAVEWTPLTEVSDASVLKDMGLDKDNPNYEEIIVKQAAISAAYAEIVVIKAKDVDEAVKDLEAHKEKISQDAFYPMHQDLAKQAIIGKQGNYAYLIANENGADAEKALQKAIDEMENK